MADVIEICSTDDESDPVAKINSKLTKGLTVTQKYRKVPTRRKVFSPKKKMPTILNTVSLANKGNGNQSKPARAKRKIPVNFPSGITVTSVTKQNKRPAEPVPDKVIFKSGNTPIRIPKQVAELLSNTLKSNSSLNTQVQKIAPSVNKTRNISQNLQMSNQVAVKNATAARGRTTDGNTFPKLPLSVAVKRKTNDVPVPVNPPTAPKRRNVAQKVKKDNITIEKLKNNKNIVMKATSGQASGKENTVSNLEPSLSIITVVNLEDSDNESKENEEDPLISERNGIVAPSNEIFEIDCDSREAVSIISDNTDVSNTSEKLQLTTKRRGRRKNNSLGNTTISKNSNSNKNNVNDFLSSIAAQPLNHLTEDSIVDNDVEMIEDPYIIDTIGSSLTNNLTIASGMSEGECIGIDDNDIQIIEMNDDRPKITSLPEEKNPPAVALDWLMSDNQQRTVPTIGKTKARKRTTPKRISNTLVSSLKEPAKQSNIPPPLEENLNSVETMIIDYESPQVSFIDTPVNSVNISEPVRTTEHIQKNQDEKATSSMDSTGKPQTSSGVEFKYSNVYQKFIALCFELDNSDDMKKIVEKKVKSYYRLVDERFVKLGIFEKLVLDNMELMRKKPEYKHLYIKNVVDELSAKRKMRYGEKSETIDVDDESKMSGKRWVSEKHIEKLEKALNKLHKAIKLLEEKEVNFEDDDESVFLMTERYKARAVRVYEKLCSLRGMRASQQNPAVQGLRRGDLGNSPGIAALTTWLIKGGYYAFPDYRDVLECVKADIKKLKLSWSDGKIEDEAQKLFTNCGHKLKRARQANAWAGAYSVISFKPDPANEDPELREKLVANADAYKMKEEEIINHFAEQQVALRLEPEPVDDSGQVEVPPGEAANSVEPSKYLSADDDTISSVEMIVPSTVQSTIQIPIGLISELETERPSRSNESQDLLRVVGYDYIPLNMV